MPANRRDPLYRLVWVCRHNEATREAERREYWSVREWQAFYAASVACGMKLPSIAKLLARGASAEEMCLELGKDPVGAKIRLQYRDELALRRLRRAR